MPLELISSDRCPFVQRSVVTLEEKGVPYELTLIDPYQPPDWFSKISPLGKVPVLKVDDQHVLFESAVINEYLDETTPGSLHPADPLEKAVNRSWIEFGGGMLSDTFKLMTVATESEFNDTKKNLVTSLQRVEKALDSEGPFFNGAEFSLVDAAYAPLFVRIKILSELLNMNFTDASPRIQQWAEALMDKPAVKAINTPILPQRFIELMTEKASWAHSKLSLAR